MKCEVFFLLSFPATSIFLFIHKTIFWSSFLHLRLFALSRFQAPHMDRCFPFHFIVVVVDGNKMLLAFVSKSSSLNSWGSLLSELLYGKTEYYVLIIAAFLPSFTQLFLYLLHNNNLLSVPCLRRISNFQKISSTMHDVNWNRYIIIVHYCVVILLFRMMLEVWIIEKERHTAVAMNQ